MNRLFFLMSSSFFSNLLFHHWTFLFIKLNELKQRIWFYFHQLNELLHLMKGKWWKSLLLLITQIIFPHLSAILLEILPLEAHLFNNIIFNFIKLAENIILPLPQTFDHSLRTLFNSFKCFLIFFWKLLKGHLHSFL